jgi:ureidoacrylate peracid hydrolase
MDARLPEWSPLLDPHQTAVLVVDVQTHFTRTVGPRLFPPVEDVLRRMRRFVDGARGAGVPIVRIRVVLAPETRSEVWLRQYAPEARDREPLAPDAAGAGFHPGFEPRPGEVVITKHRYSAFFGTPLDSVLRHRGVRTVVIVGLTTDVCVGMTARDAFQREYNVVTLADCTAEVTQARHEAGLATLTARFGLVCTSTDLLQIWNPSRRPPSESAAPLGNPAPPALSDLANPAKA